MTAGFPRRAPRIAESTRRQLRRAVLALGMLAMAGGQAGATASRSDDAQRLIIVAGVGGTPEHRERFSGWARDLCAAALASPVPARVRVLVERPADTADPDDPCAPAGRSTGDVLAGEIEAAGAAAPPEAGLVLILIGHGTAGQDPRFQLPGPDLSPERLEEMLQRAGAGPVTIAHLGSASGAFVPVLSGPGRVVLAATRANETNETRFPRHFIAALAGNDGDRNKDGRLSALEVFDFARRGVERDYEQEGLLRTEHPILDDNGDGVGSLEPEAAAGSDGVLAGRRVVLVQSAEAVADSSGDTPEIRRLIAERDVLAARVDELRDTREGLEEETYLAELEDLLLQIAEIAERIAVLRQRTE